MERIENAFNLISLVLSTMDTITITGIENQSKLVGCAQTLENIAQDMEKYLCETKKEVADG